MVESAWFAIYTNIRDRVDVISDPRWVSKMQGGSSESNKRSDKAVSA